MEASVPLPSQNTFGRGSPDHRESLTSSTAPGQDWDKAWLIRKWGLGLEDGRETPSTLETTLPDEPPPKDALLPEEDSSEYKEPEDFNRNGTPSVPQAVGKAQPSPHNQQSTKNGHWGWDPESRDFVLTKEDGSKQFYTVYQRQSDLKNNLDFRKPGAGALSSVKPPPPASHPQILSPPPETADSEPSYDKVSKPSSLESVSSSSSKDISAVIPRPPRPIRRFEEPLNYRFQVVKKPKRFFSVGRIFKTPWFEPGAEDAPGQPSDREWRDACPPFHSTRPIAKFRWFVVVRRRLNHTLCFSITTFGGPGAARARRDRAVDFVVLHKAEIEAPDPYEEEEITRDPLKVIIEEGEQYISPLARLDCGRVYTVEDNLRVLKIGRIHPASLPALEEYYRESALA